MLACVSEALDSPTPAPRVVMMKRSDMLEQFGPYDGYYRAGDDLPQGTRRPTAGLLAHEAARAVLASAGRPLDAAAMQRRRECGRW